MVNHRFKCIFIHQRKAAGTTIMAAFNLRRRHPEWRRFNEGPKCDDWDLRTKAERAYFVFSVVRNPFDRLVSAWRYLEATRSLPLIEVLRNPPSDPFVYRHMFRLQCELLSDHSGRIVADDLIRYESLQPDFDRVCTKIGKPPVMLNWLNSTTRDRDYRIYFDEECRQLAGKLVERDLVAFNYAF